MLQRAYAANRVASMLPNDNLIQVREIFNREVGLDVLEVKLADGRRVSILNAVCLGTTFQQCWIVRMGGGTPTSSVCLREFVKCWTNWAEWPSMFTTDRGVHNRGIFASTSRRNSCYFREAGLESPEQIGRVERRGALFKSLLRRVITEHNVTTEDELNTAIAEG